MGILLMRAAMQTGEVFHVSYLGVRTRENLYFDSRPDRDGIVAIYKANNPNWQNGQDHKEVLRRIWQRDYLIVPLPLHKVAA